MKNAKRIGIAAFTGLIGIGFFVQILGWPVGIILFWDSMATEAASGGWGLTAMIAVCFFITYVLVHARKMLPQFCGITELAIGVAVCAGAMLRPPEDQLLAVLAFIGGIYVMTNGLQSAMSLSWFKMFSLD